MAHDAKFSLDTESLRQRLGEATYARAREVYILQKVRDDLEVFTSGAQNWHFIGLVGGSQRELYEVDVDAEITPWGEISALSSECTCKAPAPCKHAGALLLKAAYREGTVIDGASGQSRHAAPKFPQLPNHNALQGVQSAQALLVHKEQRAVEQWLDLFARETESEALLAPDALTHIEGEQRPGSGQERLLVLVWPGQHNQVPLLMLGLFTAREKLGGGWGKPRAVKAWEEFKLPHEREIAGLVRSLTSRNSLHALAYNAAQLQDSGVISGASGALALQLSADHGCLLWSEDGKTLGSALHLGAPRNISWEWQDVTAPNAKEVTWRLRASVEGATVYNNQPPMYWDQNRREMGKVVAAGMEAERLQQLLKSPPIPQSAWVQHEQVMLRHLSGLPLPPFATAPQEIAGLKAQPTLTVQRVSPDQVARYGMLMATLHFAYGDVAFFSHRQGSPVLHMVQAKAQSLDETAAEKTQETETRKVLLHRDLPAEMAAISFLSHQGLQGNTQGQFYLSPQSLNQEMYGMLWLRWLDEGFASFEQAGFRVVMDEQIRAWVTRAEKLQVKLRSQSQSQGDIETLDQRIPGQHVETGSQALVDAEPAAAWFDLSLGIEVAGERMNILPILPALIAQLRSLRAQSAYEPSSAHEIALPDFIYVPRASASGSGGAKDALSAGWLRLPTEPLKPWLAALLELVDPSAQIQGESLRLSRFDALRLTAALGEGVAWEGAGSLKKLVAQLQGGVNALQTPLLPETLKAELRPYQLQGVSWLQFLREQQLAGVLADDMGLGKTLQTLTHILLEKENGRLSSPALIVAPVSLLGNWQREAAKFTPTLRTLVLHGTQRHEAAQDLQGADIVLTSYSLLGRDRERWHGVQWALVVLDEAQNIKNASTDIAHAAFELPARQRLCLSGTPMENHLGELWSLFHFLMPGFLGSQRQFKELYRTPIEKHGSSERLAELSRRVTPFMLRRTKQRVASDLPDKIETLSTVTLEGKQADLYETIRLSTEKAVREALSTRGLAKSQIQVLDALLKLRQVCCDPRLVPTPAASIVKQSAKLEHLMDILPEMLAEGRKVLLFSQFTSMLELIEEELAQRKMAWVKLTGQSKKRDDIIEQFTSGQVPLFLISLKAGGVGLNLPQADTVIHYDPWWNPAVENQATDRAHRIGQTSQVFVYKLVASGTIEERMLALQERKAALAQSMLSGAQTRQQALFTEDDVAQLLRPLGEA